MRIDRIMKQTKSQCLTSFIYISALSIGLIIIPLSSAAHALAVSNPSSTANQSLLKSAISAGDGEISRRLTTLNSLATGINSAQHLSSSDKSSLSSEVSTETAGLNTIQTKLNAETTVSEAVADDTDVITEYRVYVLVVPKVYIVIAADNQQSVEAALTKAASGFQAVLTNAQNAGKNVSSLQPLLSDLNSRVTAANSISSNMESSVVSLQPSDYNSDHTLLVGDYNTLQTAQSDNQAALNDANQLLSGVQNL
jgi:hypothetical protein